MADIHPLNRAIGEVPFSAKPQPPMDAVDPTSTILSHYFAGRLSGGAREVYERGKILEGFSQTPGSSDFGKYPAGYADNLLRHIGYRYNNGTFEMLPEVEGSPMAKRRLQGDVAQLIG